MALATVNLKFGVNLKDFTTKLDQVEKDSVKFGKRMQNIGQDMSLYISAPLAGFATLAGKTFMDFDNAMRKVQATSGATASEFELLTKKAQEMGASTKFSASEAAEAMNYMAMAGWKTQDIMEGISGVMAGAAASGESLALVSDIVTDGLTAFGLKASDSGKFVDVLAAASSNANTNIAMMGESFKYVAPVAGALGFSVNDMALSIGLMANAGIKGTQSGTALRAILSRLVKPTAEAKEAMDALGITVTNQDGTMKPFSVILEDLRAKFANLTPAQKAMYAGMLSGQEAMSGMLAMVNAAPEDFAKLSDAINNSAGKAQEMAGILQGGIGGAIDSLKSATEGLLIQFGEVLAPVLIKVADGLTILVNLFSGMSDTMKIAITVVGGLLAAIGPLITIVGVFSAKIIPLLIAGWKVLVPLFTLATLKIVAIVAGVGLLVAAGIAVYKSWETVREFFSQMWDKVRILFINGVASVLMTFNKFTSVIGMDFSKTIDSLENEGSRIKSVLDSKPVVTFRDVWADMTGNVKSNMNDLKNTVIGDAGEVKTVLQDLNQTMSLAGGSGVSKPKRTQETAIAGPTRTAPGLDLSGLKSQTSQIKLITSQALSETYATMLRFSMDVKELIQSSIAPVFMSIGQSIGEALASGQNVFTAVGKSILQGMGQFLQRLGKLMIEYGTAALIKGKLDMALLVPGAGLALGPLAIAAGVALIAAGAAIGSFTSGRSNGGGGGQGGGPLGPASSRPGRRAMGGNVIGGKSYIVGERGPELFSPGVSGVITANEKMGGSMMQEIKIVYEGILRGQDIYISGQEYLRRTGRTT